MGVSNKFVARNGLDANYNGITNYGNYPSIRPTLNLNFASSESVDSDVTFARNSTATRVNKFGLIESVAANVPRIDYDPVTGECLGLLIEEQRTNLLTYSEQFDGGAWLKTRSSITANAALAPDGSLSADKLVIDTTDATNHSIGEIISVTSGLVYTHAVYAKAEELSYINLRFSSQFPAGNTSFDLTSGIKTNNGSISSSITPVGNGWYRCTITQTASATGTTYPQVFLADAGGFITIATGDGTSGLYLWGAQLEAGSFPTSYIPTEATTVTRLADAASMTGENFSSWYRQDEGSFIVTVLSDSIAGTQDIISVNNNGATERLRLLHTSTTQLRFSSITGNSETGIINKTAVSTEKIAAAYKLNDYAFSLNGDTVGTDTSVAVPTVSQINIGSEYTGTNNLNGHIANLTYYPKKFDAATLEELSK